MELKINFDSEKASDLLWVKAFGLSLQASAHMMSDGKLTLEEDSTAAEEKAPESTEPAPVEETPKKRTSRKKKEEPKEEPVAETAPEPYPEPQEEKVTYDDELPFDTDPEPEPEPVKPQPAKFPTMTKDEWTEINRAKREELGLVVSGEHGDLIRDFNRYCQRRSEIAFGNPKPSTLPAEQLWQFANWFKTIELNPDYVPGSADENTCDPFVSAALSKEA